MKRKKLRRYQRRGLKFIDAHRGCALVAMRPGTGKTLLAIHAATLPALVICRRDDFLTWKEEIYGYMAVDSINFIESKDAYLPDQTPQWTIITYDLMRQPNLRKYVKRTKFKTVICDEVHLIKRWKAKRTKAVIRATWDISRRMGLTGTPITNEPLDIFTQALFVDHGATFGNNEWKFKNRYYLRSGPGWYPRKKAKPMIRAKMKAFAFSVHEDDVLKLPPKRNIMHSAAMSKQQRKHYEEVLDEWETMIRDKLLEIDMSVVQLGKLRQIASGFIYDEEKVPFYLKCPKHDLLMNMLDDKDQLGMKDKIVIYCAHNAEIDRIHHDLECRHVVFRGPRGRRDLMRKKFYRNPKIRVFLCQVDRAVGMNELVVADTAVYYSKSYRAVSMDQSKARIRRIGSERHKVITYRHLVTEGSVEEQLHSNLKSMKQYADEILEGIRLGGVLRDFV